MTRASDPRSRIYYGWYVIAASFLIIFFTQSIRNSFGIYFKAIIAEYSWSRAQLSLPVAFSLILFGALQPIAGLLVARYGARAVMTVSVLIMSIGFLGMSQIDSLLGIYIFFGVLVAIGGAGTSFTPITSLL
ncbi:MAG: MFS transporter, partial [Nitrospinota bacterium]|nr:MFS transporter [Nitrospinota bacterium]